MISAVIDTRFRLPDVQPIARPLSFNRDQLRNAAFAAVDPAIEAVVERVQVLRGPGLTVAFNMKLSDLVPPVVRQSPHFRPGLVVPLTALRLQGERLYPKVAFRVVSQHQLNENELLDYHTACRRVGIGFMCITDAHLAEGYLESRHFKLSFKAAFFCDSISNTTIFCPTLRDWGFERWNTPVTSGSTYAGSRFR